MTFGQLSCGMQTAKSGLNPLDLTKSRTVFLVAGSRDTFSVDLKAQILCCPVQRNPRAYFLSAEAQT